MSKYRAVYDAKGKAYEFVDGECVWVREDLGGYSPDTPNHAPTVMPDLPDFVSPIDGRVVSGRAGMRDHCARHNVVPTAELKGLPLKRTFNPTPPSPEYREATKRAIAAIMDSRGYR